MTSVLLLREMLFPGCLSPFGLRFLLGEAKSITMKMWFYGWSCPGLEEGKGLRWKHEEDVSQDSCSPK